MTERLTPERIEQIRALTASQEAFSVHTVNDLLGEFDVEKARADYLLMDRDTIEAKRAELRDAVARLLTLCASHRGEDWCERVLVALNGTPSVEFDVPHDQAFADWLRACNVIREDGSFNVEQALKELSDFRMCITEVAKVYWHITGGLVSKPHSRAEAVIALADDANTLATEEAVKEAREEHEEAGRAAERADALAWLRATPARWTLGEGPWSPVERAIAAGDHEGAAGRAKEDE